MTDKDPFNFDLRVSTDKKKRKTGRRGMSGAFETSQRKCEHPACEEAGQYRAPKSPDNLEDFFYFLVVVLVDVAQHLLHFFVREVYFLLSLKLRGLHH